MQRKGSTSASVSGSARASRAVARIATVWNLRASRFGMRYEIRRNVPGVRGVKPRRGSRRRESHRGERIGMAGREELRSSERLRPDPERKTALPGEGRAVQVALSRPTRT